MIVIRFETEHGKISLDDTDVKEIISSLKIKGITPIE